MWWMWIFCQKLNNLNSLKLAQHESRVHVTKDDVIEDSVEQVEVEQYRCDECEYSVKYLTAWKGLNWLNK